MRPRPDFDRSMLDTLREHDPSWRRTDALANLRRALVVLCAQVCVSELTNPDKLTVLWLISNDREARPSVDHLLARHRHLEDVGDVPLWPTDARRFISLAADAYQDAANALTKSPVETSTRRAS